MKNIKINKPPLYDTSIYQSWHFYGFFKKWEKKDLIEYHKGLFDYDENKFFLTQKQFDAISKNPKRSFDFDAIKTTGYKIIEKDESRHPPSPKAV